MPRNGSGWAPTAFRRFVRSYPTSLCTSLVEMDQGFAYLKGLGNREHPNCLACEVVGTALADWLGAETLDWDIYAVKREDEIPILEGRVQEGGSFVTRAEQTGVTWSGDEEDLTKLSNPSAISKLVVLDTWFRNCDRHAPDGLRINRDNVLLVRDTNTKKQYRLLAMDFTHAFSCGHELTRRMSYIEYVKDESVYGLFPEFVRFLDITEMDACAERLNEITSEEIGAIMQLIPDEWHVSRDVKASWSSLLLNRARFLADSIVDLVEPQRKLALGD